MFSVLWRNEFLPLPWYNACTLLWMIEPLIGGSLFLTGDFSLAGLFLVSVLSGLVLLDGEFNFLS